MRVLRSFILCLVATGVISIPLSSQPAPGYDLLIRNGRVLDGTGNPWQAADIAVRGGRIAAMGRLEGASASRTIDAAGLTVVVVCGAMTPSSST